MSFNLASRVQAAAALGAASARAGPVGTAS
eukprot:COSAG02_NODE_22975_length_733_cov_5.853312_1_plen_29_part_10